MTRSSDQTLALAAGPIGQLRAFVASLAITLAVVLLTAGASAQDRPCGSREPVATLRETGDALYSCWQPPAGSEGMEITLVFSLRRNGTLIGRPRVTWSKLSGDQGQQRAFVASVLTALDEALPLPFTDSMGGAVAGRPLALRFAVGSRTPIRSL